MKKTKDILLSSKHNIILHLEQEKMRWLLLGNRGNLNFYCGLGDNLSLTFSEIYEYIVDFTYTSEVYLEMNNDDHEKYLLGNGIDVKIINL